MVVTGSDFGPVSPYGYGTHPRGRLGPWDPIYGRGAKKSIGRTFFINHSGHKVQYASKAYQSGLKGTGIVYSMSRKGNVLKNSVAERFFLTIKRELVKRTFLKPSGCQNCDIRLHQDILHTLYRNIKAR